MKKITILTCALLCSSSLLAIAKGSSENQVENQPLIEKQLKAFAKNNDPVIRIDDKGEFKVVYGGKDISRAGLTSAHNYSGELKTLLA